MNTAALFHRTMPAFAAPSAADRLDLRLLTAREDVRSVELWYWDRVMWYPDHMDHTPVFRAYRDESRDEWRISLPLEGGIRSLDYFFELTGNDGTVAYLTDYGVSTKAPRSGFFEYLCSDPEDVFTVPEWAQGAVWYQIFPERFAVGDPTKAAHPYVPWESKPTLDNWFGGDLKGITQHMDYLADFGAEILYLNPVFTGMFTHKYAVTDYFSVDPDFGTLDDLKELVAAAHRRGIRVVLDGVFNHSGENFFAFRDLWEKGAASAYKNWYICEGFPLGWDPLNYRCFEHFGFMPKLRTADPEVRAFIIRVMNYWIETAGIDGWRLDVADEVERGTWQEIRAAVKRTHPNTILMAETWCDAYPMLGDGCGVDCSMNYQFLFAVRDWIAFRTIDAVEMDRRLNHLLMKYPDAVNRIQFNLLDSHDTARFLHECGEDKERLKLAVALQMCFIGAPSVYYGDEVGVSGGGDPDCRRTMIWDPDKQDHELYDWYRRLIGLRRSSAALRRGTFRTVLSLKNLLIFERAVPGEQVFVVINAGEETQVAMLPLNRKGTHEELLGGQQFSGTELVIPPLSVKIVR